MNSIDFNAHPHTPHRQDYNASDDLTFAPTSTSPTVTATEIEKGTGPRIAFLNKVCADNKLDPRDCEVTAKILTKEDNIIVNTIPIPGKKELERISFDVEYTITSKNRPGPITALYSHMSTEVMESVKTSSNTVFALQDGKKLAEREFSRALALTSQSCAAFNDPDKFPNAYEIHSQGEHLDVRKGEFSHLAGRLKKLSLRGSEPTSPTPGLLLRALFYVGAEALRMLELGLNFVVSPLIEHTIVAKDAREGCFSYDLSTTVKKTHDEGFKIIACTQLYGGKTVTVEKHKGFIFIPADATSSAGKAPPPSMPVDLSDPQKAIEKFNAIYSKLDNLNTTAKEKADELKKIVDALSNPSPPRPEWTDLEGKKQHARELINELTNLHTEMHQHIDTLSNYKSEVNKQPDDKKKEFQKIIETDIDNLKKDVATRNTLLDEARALTQNVPNQGGVEVTLDDVSDQTS